jgi:hypothetical protein
MHHVGRQFDRCAIGVSGDVLDSVSHMVCLTCAVRFVAIVVGRPEGLLLAIRRRYDQDGPFTTLTAPGEDNG